MRNRGLLLPMEETKIVARCIRCGRKLKSEESKRIGYGPTCNKKRLNDSGKYRGRRLF